MYDQVEAHFCEGLVGAAKQTNGWVITGGTDSGVMDLVGRAMHRGPAAPLYGAIYEGDIRV